jgi:hypothetical protein
MIQTLEDVRCQEIKKVSLKFRGIASRLLKTRYENGMDNLIRLLSFIDSNAIIYEFIQKQLKEANQDFSDSDLDRCNIPSNNEANEIKFVYLLLKRGSVLEDSEDRKYAYFNNFSSCYSASSKVQDCVDKFNEIVVHPFIEYILIYLTELQIDLGESGLYSKVNNYHSGGNMSIDQSKSEFSVAGSIKGNFNNLQGDKSMAFIGDDNQVNLENFKKDDVLNLLNELKCLIQDAELPLDTKVELIEDLDSTTTAIDKKEPNKKRASDRLTSIAETMEKTSKSLDSAQKIWQVAKPLLFKIGSLLGTTEILHILNP